MGRKQFRQDLSVAGQQPPLHIQNIEAAEDGQISFDYTYVESGVYHTVALQLLACNIDDYPYDNEYMIFSRDGEVSHLIVNAFEILCPIIKNKTITDALQEVASGLHQAVTSGHSSNPIVLPSSSDPASDASDVGDSCDIEDGDDGEDWLDDDEDEAFGFAESKTSRLANVRSAALKHLSSEDKLKIKTDLRETKEAGFKIGIIGDLSSSGTVSVAIRVSKLGISEEVMKAWGLESHQYFVLLIRFQNGYRNIETLKEEAKLSGLTEIRLGLCSSYKPNANSIFDAFTETSQQGAKQDLKPTSTQSSTDLQPLFIGRPLNELFRSRFTRIVKFREIFCLGWAGAEQLVHDTQGAITDTEKMGKYDSMVDDNGDRALPDIVMADVMSEKRLKHCSLPLVTMQFALRHFVRCTDFCLVCHCNSGSTFEALKPYVCSNPLCLYQYMGLGFGPSIEWEILSQPYVVDLLLSFCYAQAQAGRLKDFPIGIDLRVPMLPQYAAPFRPTTNYGHYSQIPQITTPASSPPDKSFSVLYNAHIDEILFPATEAIRAQELRTGDFIALVSEEYYIGVIYHRVEKLMLPSVKLMPAVYISHKTKESITARGYPEEFIKVDCYLFSHSFDDLTNEYKAKAIMALLDTIPPVGEILQYLDAHKIGQEPSLRQWRDRILPSALNVLRWIIASNRSCIMQVDTIVEAEEAKTALPSEDRLTGMDDYMQFRFAQGAPDKEQRFIDCVKSQTGDGSYPTLFAWHGSPLHNWHSIIREGLHFRDVNHGRAYGHGVYMSNHASTAVSYMGGHHNAIGPYGWPNSVLKITGAMSLNEVVNKPESFVSQSPHYVVGEIDWIQTRYLLVKTSASHSQARRAGMEVIPQNPGRNAWSIEGKAVEIPVTAIAKSRRPKRQVVNMESRKRKSGGTGHFDDPLQIVDDDIESVATLDEDRDYLLDNESHTGCTPIVLDSDTDAVASDVEFDLIASPKKRVRSEARDSALQLVDGCLLDVSKSDFYPGALNMSAFQRLPPPVDASRTASHQLLKAFNTLVKTQSTTVAHELGWYMDPQQVENMYQWIIELHSFEEDLPLAQDMKSAGIRSIVLEMQFTSEFPWAPPFVRVVKPRFLPFSQGGGGHVTEGGAICMELLTNNGWTAVSSIESVLLQIRLAMSEREQPARLPGHTKNNRSGTSGVYGVGEAIVAYERACRAHGWTVPASFSKLQRGG